MFLNGFFDWLSIILFILRYLIELRSRYMYVYYKLNIYSLYNSELIQIQSNEKIAFERIQGANDLRAEKKMGHNRTLQRTNSPFRFEDDVRFFRIRYLKARRRMKIENGKAQWLKALTLPAERVKPQKIDEIKRYMKRFRQIRYSDTTVECLIVFFFQEGFSVVCV